MDEEPISAGSAAVAIEAAALVSPAAVPALALLPLAAASPVPLSPVPESAEPEPSPGPEQQGATLQQALPLSLPEESQALESEAELASLPAAVGLPTGKVVQEAQDATEDAENTSDSETATLLPSGGGTPSKVAPAAAAGAGATRRETLLASLGGLLSAAAAPLAGGSGGERKLTESVDKEAVEAAAAEAVAAKEAAAAKEHADRLQARTSHLAPSGQTFR